MLFWGELYGQERFFRVFRLADSSGIISLFFFFFFVICRHFFFEHKQTLFRCYLHVLFLHGYLGNRDESLFFFFFFKISLSYKFLTCNFHF